MKISIDTDVDHVLVIFKKNKLQFLLEELLVYLSQVFMFFIVSFLVSNTLKDEAALVAFVQSKINQSSFNELLYSLIAAIFMIGCLAFISRLSEKNKLINALTETVINSIPRTIYFFGSSVTGSVISVAVFSKLNPSAQNTGADLLLFLSTCVGLFSFITGCSLRYHFEKKVLHRKQHNA